MTFPRVIAAATLALLFQATSAEAAAFRTWVSSGGDDANTCTRAQPCATFAGAIDDTNAGGEINCVDAGQYGRIDIQKPLTIDCAGTQGALGSGSTQNLINISISEASFPNAVVRLRNLTLNMAGTTADSAVVITQGGAEVHIENCAITGVAAAGKAAIRFTPGSSVNLFIRDSFIGGNIDAGISVAPLASAFGRVSLNNVRLDHNGAGISVVKSSAGTAVIILEDVRIENSTGIAIKADGAGAFAFVSNSTVALNGTPYSAVNSGKIFSFGNNTLAGNANVGSTPTQLLQQ